MQANLGVLQPDVAVPNAEDAVVAAMMSIGRLMKTKLAAGLDPGTMHLLHVLSRHPSLRITDLATATRLDVSTVSRHVAGLEKSGLVERHPHADDGRAQAVDLSAAGHRELQRAVEVRKAVLADLLSSWDRDRVEQFAELLTAFAAEADNRTAELEQQ